MFKILSYLLIFSVYFLIIKGHQRIIDKIDFSDKSKLIKRTNEHPGESSRGKAPLNIDLNEEYVPGMSPVRSSEPQVPQSKPHTLQWASSYVDTEKETKKTHNYVYIPRRSADELKQTKEAIRKRKRRQELRENNVEGYLEQLEKEKKQRELKNIRFNELKQINKGKSMRPWNVRVRQARERKKDKVATTDDLKLLEHVANLAKKSKKKHKMKKASETSAAPSNNPS